MHQEHAKPTVISRNRNSLLRALMERLRGRTVSRARRAEVETGILLDQSRSELPVSMRFDLMALA